MNIPFPTVTRNLNNSPMKIRRFPKRTSPFIGQNALVQSDYAIVWSSISLEGIY